METVIVTGAAGYIGKAIVGRLYHEGHEIIAIDKKESVKELSDTYGDAVTAYQVDLAKYDDQYKLFENHIIDKFRDRKNIQLIHLAAHKDIEESIKYKFAYYNNNINSTVNIVKTALTMGAWQIIFSSTSAVYSDDAHGAVTENQPCHPSSPYGISKLVCENFIQTFCKEVGVESIILRYQNPIGNIPNVTFDNSGSLFCNISKSIKYKKVFEIYGDSYPTPDGTCIRDYVDLRDLVEVHMDFLEPRIVSLSGVYNVGTGIPHTVKEVCKITKSIFPEFEYKVVSPRNGDSAGSYADTTKLNKLGFKCDTPFEKTVKDLI